jgi:hypothetical protein
MTRCAIKQPEAELRFQLSYQDAEARRRNVEGFSGAGEASMLRHQKKGPELTRSKFHS